MRRRVMKMLGMQKGGKYAGPVNGTNDFQNYYLQKYCSRIFSQIAESPLKMIPDINSEIKPGSILWVIDMQNDFIDIPMVGLTGPPAGPGKNIGAFAVSEGFTMIEDLLNFIRTNGSKFTKIVFTRDFHPPQHCSFSKDLIPNGLNGEPSDGKFPKHCVYDSLGADFTPKIKAEFEFIDGQYKFMGFPADIIFKGHHENTDSFTAQEWVDDSSSYPQTVMLL
jgi:nicotinamidase-related amidase